MIYINIPYSKKGYNLIKLLYRLGYINTYFISVSYINIVFKWYKNNNVLNKLFFYSKPGYIKTISYKELIKLKNKNKILILSNSNGICTSEDAIIKKKGGILIAEIA